MQFLNRITAQSLMTRFNDLLYAIYRLKKTDPGTFAPSSVEILTRPVTRSLPLDAPCRNIRLYFARVTFSDGSSGP
jgi:hypothetical protein